MTAEVSKAIRTATDLANEISRNNRNAFQNKLAMCSLFAQGWEYYLSESWDDSSLEEFLTSLHKSGIGSDPNKTILEKKNADGRYAIGTNCASFYSMLSVGRSDLFKDSEVVLACRVSSISSLYAIVRFYELLRTPKDDGRSIPPSVAKKRILAMLRRDGELTRDAIFDEIRKLKTPKETADLSVGEVVESTGVTRSGVTYEQLVNEGKTFASILLSPSVAELDAFDESLEPVFDFGFIDVRDANTKLSIKVKGNRLGSALRWGTEALQIEDPKVYCVSETEFSGRALDISDLDVVVSNAELKFETGNSDVGKTVKNAVKSDGENLAMYVDDEDEGWTSCGG